MEIDDKVTTERHPPAEGASLLHSDGAPLTIYKTSFPPQTGDSTHTHPSGPFLAHTTPLFFRSRRLHAVKQQFKKFIGLSTSSKHQREASYTPQSTLRQPPQQTSALSQPRNTYPTSLCDESKAFVKIDIQNQRGDFRPAIFLLDTGAAVNIISNQTLRMIERKSLVPDPHQVHAITGDLLLKTEFSIKVRWCFDPEKSHSIPNMFRYTDFLVADRDLQVDGIIGLRELNKLGIRLSGPGHEIFAPFRSLPDPVDNAATKRMEENRSNKVKVDEAQMRSEKKHKPNRRKFAFAEANKEARSKAKDYLTKNGSELPQKAYDDIFSVSYQLAKKKYDDENPR